MTGERGMIDPDWSAEKVARWVVVNSRPGIDSLHHRLATDVIALSARLAALEQAAEAVGGMTLKDFARLGALLTHNRYVVADGAERREARALAADLWQRVAKARTALAGLGADTQKPRP